MGVCQLRHEEELGRSFIKDAPCYPRWRKKRKFKVWIFGISHPTKTQTIHLAVKFLIDAIENPNLVLRYASTNHAPGPSKIIRGKISVQVGWVALYMARFPDHPNTRRMQNRVGYPVTHNYLTLSLDEQIQKNGTGSGDWNFVNGRCFYAKID